mmetsp:Transcript_9400/g.21892  ORF Transcript_9400/g.21892 Transcript_9400/m.21892 type:complete len:237 (+) Transcript_9400:206-916(+)
MLKEFKDYTPTEIGLWLTAQGLGQFAEKFQEEGVDGDLLLSLSSDDLKNDLGLSNIQTKKVLKNVEFSRDLGSSAGTGGEEAEALRRRVDDLQAEKDASAAEADGLREKLKDRDDELRALRDELNKREEEAASLREELEGMKSAATVVEAEPEPAAPPKPAQAAPPSHSPHANRRRGPGVVGGAARGAAGGAVKGAIVGAILPGMDAGDGASAGAAVGAFSGGVGGLRGRRARRFG